MVIAFISAAFGGGLLVFVQFLITRHDQKNGTLAAIGERMDGLFLKMETFEIITVRRYIFGFFHSMQKGERHTREEWEQVMDDIKDYHTYCQRHHEFVNNKCDITIDHIEKKYRELLITKDFEEG